MQLPQEGQVVFGIDPAWYAGSLFVLTYVLIVAERLNRAIIALSAACLMILGGVLTQQAAFEGVDFNTLGLLTGMMVIVGITKNSGVFQFLAIWAVKRVNADPWGMLVILPLTLLPIYLIWGRHLQATPENRRKVLRYRELDAITDPQLLKQSLFVLLKP
jgi:hypothetical protein